MMVFGDGREVLERAWTQVHGEAAIVQVPKKLVPALDGPLLAGFTFQPQVQFGIGLMEAVGFLHRWLRSACGAASA